MEGPGAVDRAIGQIRSGFASLAAVDLTTLTGTEVLELVQSSQRVRSMADAACVQAAGAMDVSHAWTGDGARSPSAWMQWRCRIQAGRAVTFLRCARELRDMPVTEAAMLVGDITVDHVRLLVDAKQLAPEAFAGSVSSPTVVSSPPASSSATSAGPTWSASCCQIDHVHPYESGGETTQANGQCHCGFHNRKKGRQRPPAA